LVGTFDQTTLDYVPSDKRHKGDPIRELLLVVLHHPDLRRVGDLGRLSAVLGSSWGLGRTGPLFCDRAGAFRPLEDRGVSRAPIEVAVVNGGVTLRPSATTIRVEVDDAPIVEQHYLSNERLEAGVRLTLNGRVALWMQRVRELTVDVGRAELVGVSTAMDDLRRTIHDVGRSNAPVLIRGQTGVGKERVARALHAASARSRRPFVSVNVAAVPAETAVSQLFGHVRGAFTGADARHDGWFGQADGGTLFLDEIGDLPPSLQPMLLRALESGEIQPVGGPTRRVDVRVITASDVDLEALVAARSFRDSLYFRLAQRTVDVPSLGERVVDIPILWTHFVVQQLAAMDASERASGRSGTPWMSVELVGRLLEHPWAGNVRELRAAAEAFVEANARREVAVLPTFRAPASVPVAVQAPGAGAVTERVGDVLDALERHEWAILPTARALGISRNALLRRMAALEIRRAKDVDEEEVQRALAAANGDVDAAASQLRVSARGLRLRLD